MQKIKNFIKHAGKPENIFFRLYRKALTFFAKKRREIAEKSTFEDINKLSFFEKRKFSKILEKFNMLYSQHLHALREKAKTRKICVAFLVDEKSKWHCGILHDMLSSSCNFETKILITKPLNDANDKFFETLEFFQNSYSNVEAVYNPESDEYIDLRKFSIDIIFYQQPWKVARKHSVFEVVQFALICYTPYCFHSMDAECDYLEKFHRFLWKYFIESSWHLDSYQGRFNATNCVNVGSLHLDRYLLSQNHSIKIWKDISLEKKRIIYAPHFSFDSCNKVATFHLNGRFILTLASMYPNTTWLLKPHPDFDNQILANNIMTREELSSYYDEWKKYGMIFDNGDYFDAFKNSNCLITDSISFLADYLPTGKPVFHLRNAGQTVKFNDFAKNIIDTYYQIHSNPELERLFSRVMIDGDDFMREKRISQIEALAISESASKRVFEHLKSELKITASD